MKVKEIEAKSILVESKLPDADYVVNPYTGCEIGCAYCYASFMGRFVQEPIENWGNYVYVKTNAVELAEEELSKWSPEKRQASVLLSSVTDPYQGVESKYRLSRGILEVFARASYPGLVSILTKSSLVTRDIDVLKRLPNVEVGMTVTTTDDKLSRFLEMRASSASKRLATLKRLHDEGIKTYAFIGPLLPHFRYRPDLLEELFARVAETKPDSIFVEHINLKKYIKERLWQTLEKEPAEIRDVYTGASTEEHRAVLSEIVTELVKRYNLNLRLGDVLYHNAPKTNGAEQPPRQ
jgi:DNA repair photolyase